MTNIVYRTPTQEWIVVAQNNNLWIETFGNNPFYMICKYEKSYRINDFLDPELSNYHIYRTENNPEDCFKWLKEHDLISKDEMNYRLSECQDQN